MPYFFKFKLAVKDESGEGSFFSGRLNLALYQGCDLVGEVSGATV
jgi:hypothetical protein